MGCSIMWEGLAAFHSETTEKIGHSAKWCICFIYHLQSGVYAIYTTCSSIGKMAPLVYIYIYTSLLVTITINNCYVFTSKNIYVYREQYTILHDHANSSKTTNSEHTYPLINLLSRTWLLAFLRMNTYKSVSNSYRP